MFTNEIRAIVLIYLIYFDSSEVKLIRIPIRLDLKLNFTELHNCVVVICFVYKEHQFG